MTEVSQPGPAPRATARPRRRWLQRLALLAAGLLFALLVGEAVVRMLYSGSQLLPGQEWPGGGWRNNRHAQTHFMVDKELGFRPILGPDRHYDDNGIREESRYEQPKPKGVRRVLFVGDSVTARGKINRAIQARFGTAANLEFCNAGVESFNTAQELSFYERFNHRVEPDHVILTFHMNDFLITPVTFRDRDGKLVFFDTASSAEGFDPTLFQYSYLYRVWFAWRLGKRQKFDHVAGRELVRMSLAGFRDRLAAQGVRFTVLVLPPGQPRSEWSKTNERSYTTALTLLQELRIEHFDLLPGLERALQAGVEVNSTKGDIEHPSDAAARHYAEHLAASGFRL